MMASLQEVLRLSEQLSSDDKRTLIQILQSTLAPKRPPLQLLEIDVEWPAHFTLRREEEYDDDGR